MKMKKFIGPSSKCGTYYIIILSTYTIKSTHVDMRKTVCMCMCLGVNNVCFSTQSAVFNGTFKNNSFFVNVQHKRRIQPYSQIK